MIWYTYVYLRNTLYIYIYITYICLHRRTYIMCCAAGCFMHNPAKVCPLRGPCSTLRLLSMSFASCLLFFMFFMFMRKTLPSFAVRASRLRGIFSFYVFRWDACLVPEGYIGRRGSTEEQESESVCCGWLLGAVPAEFLAGLHCLPFGFSRRGAVCILVYASSFLCNFYICP